MLRPNDILLLMAYFTTPDDLGIAIADPTNKWVLNAKVNLDRLGLIEPCGRGDHRITEKGRCLVGAFMSHPMPVQSWYIPEKER